VLLPDLFAASLDDIKPASGQDGPRLWVRRLIIWSKPGEIVREIPFRPGLNIIWSPDTGVNGVGMGHGGGKTSLCRLLRYCLGEDSFGSDEQRDLIGTALPDAHVGATIVLDGEDWTVVRPIGDVRRPHFAQPGGELDTAFTVDMPNTTMGPLLTAIAQAIMPTATLHMPIGSSPEDAWKLALPWFTRDQERRLLDTLAWRASDAKSSSPARGVAVAARVSIVRLLLNALTPEEMEASRRAQGYAQRIRGAEAKRDRISWTRNDVAQGLADVFGPLPEDDEAPTFWSDVAQNQVDGIEPDIDDKVSAAEKELEDQRELVTRTTVRLAEITAELGNQATILKMTSDELPRAETRVRDAEQPKCLSCGQPITAKEVAFISEQIALRDDYERQQQDARDEQQKLRAEEAQLRHSSAVAEQELQRRKRIAIDLKERAKRRHVAEGHVTTTARFKMYGVEIGRLNHEIAELQVALGKAQQDVLEYREQTKRRLTQLSGRFEAVICFLIPDDARGEVKIDDKGISPLVHQHGALTAAAIESLKVVAFDLAAMVLAIEGEAQLPGFWVHDSPREADLGLLLYHRLFELALVLERLTPTPLFQYVITTTTPPPEHLQNAPWTVLQLRSAPAGDRLFRCDL
jgi:hypothetical protein